jgi:1-acyl-sn-glycerol-3-phosphate acyltransferase
VKDLVSTPIGAIRLVAYVLWTLALLPLQMIVVHCGGRAAQHIPMLYHRGCCRIIGFRIERHGMPVRSTPVLFVCNHSSYLDISVLGSLIQGSFVAKTEVASWPLFGLCAKLQRSVFVDRRRGTADSQRDEITRRLECGDNLILFPEGTSNDGNRVLPFRSALLAVAEKPIGDRPLTVQPISIAYARHSNLPMGRYLRPCYAWYGETGLMGHLWRVLSLGPATVVVRYHAPVTITEHADRKALTRYCHQVVSEGVIASIHGIPRRSGRGTDRSEPAAA